jgi:hypothetical protein
VGDFCFLVITCDIKVKVVLCLELFIIVFAFLLKSISKKRYQMKPKCCLQCEKSMGLLTLLKNALREDGTPWLIKCPDKGNFTDVERRLERGWDTITYKVSK